jgi:lipoprotein signal peptidase
MVKGRLWLSRLHGFSSRLVIWGVWTAAAISLIAGSSWIPSSAIFVGLLLGGSFSNALESSRRGSVSDYVCLAFWPAFNLADLALVAGVIGTLARLLAAIIEGAS